jgi:hypothetical protein
MEQRVVREVLLVMGETRNLSDYQGRHFIFALIFLAHSIV